METNLNIAIKNLYTVFEKYTIKGSLRERSCSCCVSKTDIELLLSNDLFSLSIDEIGFFMRKAITTFGNVNDYKHFLPRILELMQFKNNDVLDDFLIFEKLNYSNWKSWDSSEVEVIQDYFTLLWTNTINDESLAFNRIVSVLNLMSNYVSWNKVFSVWEKVESLHWIPLAVDIIFENNNYDINSKTRICLLNWFSAKSILAKMEIAFLETKDKIEANRISIAYTILEQESK